MKVSNKSSYSSNEKTVDLAPKNMMTDSLVLSIKTKQKII